ncbi:MAG: hypothetical protein ACRDWY_16405 [Actinomycetes bacterium]
MHDEGGSAEVGETQREMTQEQIWQLLLETREGAEVGQIVAAMRPQRDVLGRQLDLWLELLVANLLQNTAEAARPLAEAQAERRTRGNLDSREPDDDVQLTAWRVADGTPAERDIAAWRTAGWPESILQPYREQDEGPALTFAHRIMDAAVDHLRGVAVLMGDGRVDRPPLALSRVVLDAAAHLHHVLKPRLDPEERIVRVLNETLARVGEDFRAAMRGEDQVRMGEAAEEITAILDAVGSRRKTQWNRDRATIPFIGEKPTYTSKMIEDLLGAGSMWNDLSGVVHNKEDDGWRIMLGLTLGIENPHKGQYIALHSLGAVIGIVTLTDVIAAYTDWDLSATRETNEQLSTLWAAGAGMMDGTYQERVQQQRRDDGSTQRLAREFALAVRQVESGRGTPPAI